MKFFGTIFIEFSTIQNGFFAVCKKVELLRPWSALLVAEYRLNVTIAEKAITLHETVHKNKKVASFQFILLQSTSFHCLLLLHSTFKLQLVIVVKKN